ncbi:MAG: hypothetical protein J6S63_12375 [Atopobiaceae bacterium]|nr:hypothetical protein [Atopobiaceae bacterium]
MLQPQTKLSYLAQSSLPGGGPAIDFLDGTSQWQVSFEDVRLGRVPEHVARAIIRMASGRFAQAGSEEPHAVPVVCSLRSLRDARGQVAPLLLLAGELSPAGRLTPSVRQGAWVPADRIATDEYHNQDLVVCDMDTYRAHQAAMSKLPNDGSWTVNVARATDLFDSVCALDPQLLEDQGLRLVTERSVIRLWGRCDDMTSASQVLSSISSALDGPQDDSQSDDSPSGDEAPRTYVSGPLRKLLHDDIVQPRPDESEETLPDDAYLEPKVVCGFPDHLPVLSAQDHKALAAIAMRDDDVLALATPAGTNWHAVAIAAMANEVTEHALRGDVAPTIACVAPRHDLEEMLRLLGDRPVVGLVALTSRWLPRIDEARPSHASTPIGKRTLGSLAALCLSYGAQSQHVVSSNLCLTRTYDQADTGSVTAYADAWYGPRATTYFLDCVSSFLGQRIHSVHEASSLLAERLRLIDQDRCDLIDAYAEVCKAYALHQQREGIIANILELRKEHSSCKDRLHLWEQLAKHNPARRQLFSRAPASQAQLIAEYALPNERIALEQTLIADVCAAYRKELERVEEQLDRLRGASASLTKRMSGAVASSKECTLLVSRLRTACGLTIQQGADLTQVIEARTDEVTLASLDLVLDQTVRPAEFWLALHIYECAWLELCARHDRHQLWQMDSKALSAWANLCPFFLVGSDVAVTTLSAYALGSPAVRGAQLDLALTLRSDLCDVARGMALSAMTSHLVAFGSRSSLGPYMLRTVTFDELDTTQRFDEDTWRELRDSGLAVSSGTSLFGYVADQADATSLSLVDVAHGKPEIAAFRTELVPKEPVQLCVRTSSDAVADGPLAGILPDISYVLVPDSSWAQRGPSRQNLAEAHAIGRWLKNHAHEIQEEYAPTTAHPLVIVVPYAAQAKAMAKVLGSSEQQKDKSPWDVRTPAELKNDTWPIVVLCTTCGPSALNGLGPVDAGTLLSMAASAARDALVLFCGGAWLSSSDAVSVNTMRRALRVGRLFSAPRRHALTADSKDAPLPRPSVDLRSTPVALPALLTMLQERGTLESAPDLEQVTKALVDVGLIEVFDLGEGAYGSRPTPAGREIGIIANKDRSGVTSCTYSDTSVTVIASLVQTLA